jgi:hypothetical protein
MPSYSSSLPNSVPRSPPYPPDWFITLPFPYSDDSGDDGDGNVVVEDEEFIKKPVPSHVRGVGLSVGGIISKK